MSSINHRLEQIINRSTISEQDKTLIKGAINGFFSKLKDRYIDDENWFWRFTKDLSSFHVKPVQFTYGGSFDRGVLLKNWFDVDLYVVFKISHATPKITGKLLFTLLYPPLKSVANLLRESDFHHSIPVEYCCWKYDFITGLPLKLDCVPAIVKNGDYLVIPSGYNKVKTVNPNLEVTALKHLNKKTDGGGTKLILLLKNWNDYWNRPLKSYLIELLVEEIFTIVSINDWIRGVKTFFNRSLHVFNTYLKGEYAKLPACGQSVRSTLNFRRLHPVGIRVVSRQVN